MLRHTTTPNWVYFGGMALAVTAGSINAVGFLGQHHQALSHLTGTVTVLGIACGHLLRGTAVDWFRFRIYGVLFFGFFAGGLIGTVGYNQFGYDTLLFPAVVSGVTGVGYTVIKHLEAKLAVKKFAPSDLSTFRFPPPHTRHARNSPFTAAPETAPESARRSLRCVPW